MASLPLHEGDSLCWEHICRRCGWRETNEPYSREMRRLYPKVFAIVEDSLPEGMLELLHQRIDEARREG